MLAEPALVRLAVYDLSGRRVASLIEGERRSAGTHQVSFEASRLASGVYTCRLEAGGRTETRRLVHFR